MKTAMWDADHTGSFSFTDSEDPGKIQYFRFDPISAVATHINKRGEGRLGVPVKKIEAHIIQYTQYLSRHMRAALKLLETQGKIRVHDTKKDGTRRRKGSFPKDALIDFVQNKD